VSPARPCLRARLGSPPHLRPLPRAAPRQGPPRPTNAPLGGTGKRLGEPAAGLGAGAARCQRRQTAQGAAVRGQGRRSARLHIAKRPRQPAGRTAQCTRGASSHAWSPPVGRSEPFLRIFRYFVLLIHLFPTPARPARAPPPGPRRRLMATPRASSRSGQRSPPAPATQEALGTPGSGGPASRSPRFVTQPTQLSPPPQSTRSSPRLAAAHAQVLGTSPQWHPGRRPAPRAGRPRPPPRRIRPLTQPCRVWPALAPPPAPIEPPSQTLPVPDEQLTPRPPPRTPSAPPQARLQSQFASPPARPPTRAHGPETYLKRPRPPPPRARRRPCRHLRGRTARPGRPSEARRPRRNLGGTPPPKFFFTFFCFFCFFFFYLFFFFFFFFFC
jgi:hypothetical protein